MQAIDVLSKGPGSYVMLMILVWAHMMIFTIYRVKHLGEHDPKAACKPLTRTIEYKSDEQMN